MHVSRHELSLEISQLHLYLIHILCVLDDQVNFVPQIQSNQNALEEQKFSD